jgi:glycosyltransferase involved in cell wall biosynthesis
MKPLFSLMMICYNNVQFIKTSIDSVKAQTYENWELIINDDCSTDGTYELAQKLAENEPRIKVYRNETNLMTPRNRAAASKYLSGEFIGHIDADDALYSHAVEYFVKAFEKNPEVALMYSDTAGIDSKGKITCYNLHTDADTNLAFFGWRHFGAFRMSVFKETEGYNEKLTGGCEDGDLFMQIVDTRKFMRVPHVLYYHRSHETNTSPKNHKCDSCPDRPICNYIKVWCKHAKFDYLTFKPLEQT